MCGITGIFCFNLVGKFNKIHITAATEALAKRGPDFQDTYLDEWVALGHRRLSVIDTSAIAHQPMWDESKRYGIVFNGEIFNFEELRQELLLEGVSFFSSSDTEVLLKLFIRQKEKCLPRLNGFFAFCIYDKQEQTFFVARDRFGVKPLLYLFDEDKFLFASEMKSIVQYGIEKDIDHASLSLYLQLNYIPAPDTIFKSVKKLLPGHFAWVSRKKMSVESWYQIPYSPEQTRTSTLTYEVASKQLEETMDKAVQRRLVSDVPLGSFLSGGIDSSVVTALASRHRSGLHTFSIGFRDEPFFDETNYARQVAALCKTDHTVFSLTNDDLYAHVHAILDYTDEPFADSSAIAVYILSKETRKHATVALSGDGADELAAGYNKHAAAWRVLHPGWKEKMVVGLDPLWKALPQSRNNPLANKVRQLHRFAEGAQMTSKDRYWKWATLADETEAQRLLHPKVLQQLNTEVQERKSNLLRNIPAKESINDILLTDMQLVLPNDMLAKVDLMSMANGLEVRSPFLDVNVVNLMFSLPAEYKINATLRKRIVQDTFRHILPPDLYRRPKKGFEVPMLKWLRKEMKSLITDDLLSESFITDQALFHYPEIKKLKEQLFSNNPGDSAARVWALIVFQWWWKKYLAGRQDP